MKKLLSILAALGMTATGATTVVACGSSENSTPENMKDDNAVTWGNTESNTNENNIASFKIDKVGKNVDLSQKPVITSNSSISIDWDFNVMTNTLEGHLTDGAPKANYVFTISFQLKNSNLTSTTELVVNKATASISESTVTWTDKNGTADENGNQISWTFTLPAAGSQIDVSVNPKVETLFPAGYTAVDQNNVKLENTKLEIKMNDGMPKGIIALNVSFALKNGFGWAPADQIYVTKDKATPKESTVNWNNQEQSINENNVVTWTVNDDGFGKELDLAKGPSLALEENPNGFAIVKRARWFKDSKILRVEFMDGIKKADYKFKVSFDSLNGFNVNYSTELTAKKDKPANNEIKMIPDKDYVSANYKNSLTPSWKFKPENVGLDININFDGTSPLKVVKVDDKNIEGAAQTSLMDWENMEIRFLSANAFSDYGTKGTHSITIEVPLTNGFEGQSIQLVLHYVVE